MVGVQPRRLLRDRLGDVTFRLHERGRRSLVADADALLDERVVPLRELLDLVLAALQFAVEPLPLAADSGATFAREVALDLLPRADDRFADPHLHLGEEPLAGAGVEVVIPADPILQFLEVLAGEIGVVAEQVAGLPQPHGGLLLQALGPDAPHRLEFGEFGPHGVPFARCRRDVAGQRQSGRRQVARIGGELPHRHLADERGVGIVGIAPQRGFRQPLGRRMRSRGLGPLREHRERRGLAADDRAGQGQALPAHEGQKHAVVRPGVAGEFGEIGVFLAGRGRGNRNRRGGGVILEGQFQPPRGEVALDEHDGVAVRAQRRQAARQHAEAGVRRVARNRHVPRPGDGLNGEPADPCPRLSGVVGRFRHHQHAAGNAGQRGQARPVDPGADSEAGDGDPLGREQVDEPRILGCVAAVEARAVPDVDDRTRSFRACEPRHGLFQHREQVGRAERRPRVEAEPRLRRASSFAA